mmetsp:Transcript_26/g.77  ORF Transcript_26/g.77 Transcript_26/m.77 type:complete len:426 (+) Transcript_26:92-1369(+)
MAVVEQRLDRTLAKELSGRGHTAAAEVDALASTVMARTAAFGEESAAVTMARKSAMAAIRKQRTAAKHLDKSTHKNVEETKREISELQAQLGASDANDDGMLSTTELSTLSPTLLKLLKVSGAEALLAKFDTSGDGQLDYRERHQLMNQLLPTLKREMDALIKSGEFVSARSLRQHITHLKQQFRDDHVRQRKLEATKERTEFSKVADSEVKAFKAEWQAKVVQMEADFDARQASLDDVLKSRLETFQRQIPKMQKPGGPRVPKHSLHVLKLREKLKALTSLKHAKPLDMIEAGRVQDELHRLEDEEAEQFSALQPRYVEKEFKELMRTYEDSCKKLRRQRMDARTKLQKEHKIAVGTLQKRHKNYGAAQEHVQALSLLDWAVDGVREPRPLPMLPPLPNAKRPHTPYYESGPRTGATTAMTRTA